MNRNTRQSLENLFAGGGELGELMRTYNWQDSPLGPVEDWPQSLKSCVRIILTSRQPMFIWWGESLINLYNDAYKATLGGKHPQALGRPAIETWQEIWEQVGPRAASAMTTNEGTFDEALLLIMARNGYREETYYTFSYSPVPDDEGRSGGIICAAVDDTQRIVNERQLGVLRELAARSTTARTIKDACLLSASSLTCNPYDLPFALIYLLDASGNCFSLAGTAGIERGHPAAPERQHADTDTVWPLAEAVQTQLPRLKDLIADESQPSLSGAWSTPPARAIAIPLTPSGPAGRTGVLVVGLNPFRLLDDGYRSFLGLAANQISASIAHAQAYEEERQRAEALSEIDRAKTAFFSNVSHEFRTPLTLMLGPLEDSLADTQHPLPPEQRERQELILRNSLRLQKLVNTLLDFARLEAGRVDAVFVATDLAELTTDLASVFRSAAERAGLTLVVDCEPLAEPVYVDAALWENVVLNLLSNAFKFTFAGEIRVTLRPEAGRALLTVADTGTGIPEKELPRIFDRFHRVEGTRGRSHEGSGIGLALVKELVSLHGGSIDVKSAPGKGTSFCISLPIGFAHLPAAHLQLNSSPQPRTGSTKVNAFTAEVLHWMEGVNAADDAQDTNRNESERGAVAPLNKHAGLLRDSRILVADDNVDMRRYLTRILSPHWKVETVSDGQQALNSAHASPPDLILSDVMMPGLDGLGLLRALREDTRTRSIPVVLLSARAGEEATVDALKAGADDYLVKPFSANELLARVSAQLALARLRMQTVQAERAQTQVIQKLLDEARWAKQSSEETLAIVSHDLRTPLNVITMAASFLQHILDSNGQAQPQITRILGAASRMSRLIADLLDVASLDAGTLSMHPGPHSAAAIASETMAMFEQQAKAKKQTLEAQIEADLPPLTCDHDRILQALSNLLQNAVKFTPEGGNITLRVLSEGESLVFSVADSGPGIASETQKHIFDRFWHMKQKGREGHGLGLFITKGIVATHGGELHIASSPSGGAELSMVLPVSGSSVAGAPAAGAPLKAPAGLLSPPRDEMERVFAKGGKMSPLMQSLDWAKTSLGRFEHWPRSLRATITTLLGSRYPMTLLWGQDLVQIYNEAYIGLIGDKHPDALGRSIRETQAESWEMIGPMIHQVMSSGVPNWVPAQRLALERAGYREEAYFSLSYSAVEDDDGTTRGMLCVCSEVTQQVIGERRLELLRDLAIKAGETHSVDIICRNIAATITEYPLDVPFALIYLREGSDSLRLRVAVGLTKGGPLTPTKVDLNLDQTVWPLARAAAGETVLLEDVVGDLVRIPGGPWQDPVRSALIMPLTVAGQTAPIGVLVAGISPARALDESYRSFYRLLISQVTVAVRNARAYEDERNRAEQLAELDRAKTAFFSNVSHEFRTPLTLILGPVENALAGTSRSLAGEELTLVRRNALRLFKLVNSLLDFSRAEAGRAQAVFTATDLSALTLDLASTFRSAAESAGLALLMDCPPLQEPVYVDRDMWDKIVLNLLSNAVKYTYSGRILVSLHWENGGALLRVEDTGVGITEDELPRVFERFYRARTTPGRSFEGTGIGLALVQELVHLHGGDLSVSSIVGKGSVFSVWLPAGQAHLPAERVKSTVDAANVSTVATAFVQEALQWSSDLPMADHNSFDASCALPPDTSVETASARILLVDDNADLRIYLKGLLGRIFFNIETAENGEQALAAALENPPDLILSDVMMPVLDGFGLVRELRKRAETRAIPIILLSARAGEESTVEGLNSGADDYLVKPFSAQELMARVRAQLEMARVRREVLSHELAAEQLRSSLQDRDEFLSIAAHELRTPVTALQLQIQNLMQGPGGALLDERTRQRLDNANRSVSRLIELVNVMLDISSLTSGHIELVPQPVDMVELVKEVLERFQEEALRSNTRISLSLPAALKGQWDPERIRQIVVNLLSNALKFGAGTAIDITVAPYQDSARLTIRDQGIGLAADQQLRIFQRFSRIGSARHFGGFGLGLWIVRELVDLMDGSIEVESALGQGAAFTVELPLRPRQCKL